VIWHKGGWGSVLEGQHGTGRQGAQDSTGGVLEGQRKAAGGGALDGMWGLRWCVGLEMAQEASLRDSMR